MKILQLLLFLLVVCTHLADYRPDTADVVGEGDATDGLDEDKQ